jgi:outer membrane protein assembly factor BamE
MFVRASVLIAAIFLASCGSARLPMPEIPAYRIEIQQGNFISQEMVSQLKIGMSKEQVRFILGTPLITDSFHADRWDYIFRRQKANSKELEEHKLAVFFQDEKLARVEGDATVTPRPGADPAAIKLPEPQREAQPAATPAAAPQSKPSAPAASAPPRPAPVSKAAEPAVSEPPKPAQAAAPPQPAAAPDEAPKEKSWWERIKDKVKF